MVKKNDVYKYTWLRMAEGRVVDKALMDYPLMLGRLLDVKVWRGEGGGMSDYFFVEARLKLVGGRMEGVRNLLKVSELNNSVKERAYQESWRGKYEVWGGREGGGVGKVQRYSNGVYQRCMCHETCRRAEKERE